MSKVAIYAVIMVDSLDQTEFFLDKDQAQSRARTLKNEDCEISVERDWFEPTPDGLLAAANWAAQRITP